MVVENGILGLNQYHLNKWCNMKIGDIKSLYQNCAGSQQLNDFISRLDLDELSIVKPATHKGYSYKQSNLHIKYNRTSILKIATTKVKGIFIELPLADIKTLDPFTKNRNIYIILSILEVLPNHSGEESRRKTRPSFRLHELENDEFNYLLRVVQALNESVISASIKPLEALDHYHPTGEASHSSTSITEDTASEETSNEDLNYTISYPDEFPEQGRAYKEGAIHQVYVNRYERDSEARKVCLEHYGYSCSVCSMNFEERYGSIGHEFIHVHHKKPLNKIKEDYEVMPIDDLVPVCPNCHAMLHKNDPPYSIEALKSLMK